MWAAPDTRCPGRWPGSHGSARHRVIEPGDVTGADLLRTRLAQGSQRGGDALQLRPFSLVGGEVGADGVLVGRVDRRLGLGVGAQPDPGGAGDLAQGRGQPGGRTVRRSMRLAVAQAHRGDDGGGRHGQYGPDLVRGGDQHWVLPLVWLRMSCCALNTSVVALSSSAPVVRWARAVPRNSLYDAVAVLTPPILPGADTHQRDSADPTHRAPSKSLAPRENSCWPAVTQTASRRVGLPSASTVGVNRSTSRPTRCRPLRSMWQRSIARWPATSPPAYTPPPI